MFLGYILCCLKSIESQNKNNIMLSLKTKWLEKLSLFWSCKLSSLWQFIYVIIPYSKLN